MIRLHYAHRTDSEDVREWQPLKEHLREVALLAGQFASQFRAKEWGELVGWLHDVGKYSAEFQSRLRGTPIPVDHSTAGAQLVMERIHSKRLALIPAYVIAGHHAGLPDCGSSNGEESCLLQRLKRQVHAYDAAFQDISGVVYPDRPPSIQVGFEPGFQFSFFIRMLFSCLVDADSLNSEQYENPSRNALRHHPADFDELSRRFAAYINQNFSQPKRPIDRIRSELLQECLRQADKPRGLYTMTLPTGSGKTLISLGFALEHARVHGLQRIVYVIPYTSIIEQNAAKFREVLGDDQVLEHHSNVQRESYEDQLDDEEKKAAWTLQQKLSLAEENWDFPVVVTTNVQFFESLFANRRSRCRKLHNLVNSVIILDEAQMMNGGFFKPSLYALEELTRNYGATVLLCTATQPEVRLLFPEKPAPVKITELVQDVPLRYEQFKRVRLEVLGRIEEADLTDRLAAHDQVLCIVNTRKMARELYNQLRIRDEEGIFHLSARMCPLHRLHMLERIRQRLENGQICRVISTQLIEAGVDVDFPAVYRELAGLDSIAQAAGRCNRNGKQAVGCTYVFETPQGLPPGWFRTTADVTRSVMRRHPGDPLSLAAVHDYFQELYHVQTLGQKDSTDSQGILSLLRETGARLEFPFRTVAERFQLIDNATRAVIVPYAGRVGSEMGNGIGADSQNADSKVYELLESLQHAVFVTGIMRQLQPYVVQLYPQEFEAFRRAGEIVEVRADVWKLKNPDRWYDQKLGVLPYSEDYHAQEVWIY